MLLVVGCAFLPHSSMHAYTTRQPNQPSGCVWWDVEKDYVYVGH